MFTVDSLFSLLHLRVVYSRQSRSSSEREPLISKLVSYTHSILAPTDNILTSNAGLALG